MVILFYLNKNYCDFLFLFKSVNLLEGINNNNTSFKKIVDVEKINELVG